jgi:hypothetical protein
MINLNKASKIVTNFFNKSAVKIARVTRFVQRKSEMTGPLFLQTLTFGWIENPSASLNDLADVADDLGVKITGSGINERIHERTVDFMQNMFSESVELFRNHMPLKIDILQQFSAIELLDSTTIALPDSLHEEYPGCGGDGPISSLKAQLVFNVLDGNIKKISFHAGKTPDQAYQEDIEQLLPGTLRLNDLGYFSMTRFVQIASQNAYFITRFNTQTALFTSLGERIYLLEWLKQQNESIIEAEFLIGSQTKLASRIVAIRLPQEVADRRRQKAIQKAKKKGRTPSERSLALLSWTIFMTNVQDRMLSAQQVAQLYPLRWQIELIFKLWKSEFALNRVAGLRRERVLVELYAKLIGAVLIHFIQAPIRFTKNFELSMVKAARAFRRRAICVAISLTSVFTLRASLGRVIKKMLRFGTKNKRKKTPSTLSILAQELISYDEEDKLDLAA